MAEVTETNPNGAGRPRKSKTNPNGAGRPTVMTPGVIVKLEYVFAIDGTVAEACSYADISPNSYYDYLKINPEFSNRIESLRQKPVLKARQTITKALNDPNHAFRYLERKRKKEFGPSMELETKLTISEVLDQLENGSTPQEQGLEDQQSL